MPLAHNSPFYCKTYYVTCRKKDTATFKVLKDYLDYLLSGLAIELFKALNKKKLLKARPYK